MTSSDSSESSTLRAILEGYTPETAEEAWDYQRVRRLVDQAADPWTRASALHVTASAVVVHPPTARVLLRWHDRMQAWRQVGGHADPGESDPFRIAEREAREETGLRDLVAWPEARTPRIVQVAVFPVPAGKGEPAHEHADLCYALATGHPEAVVPESPSAELAWMRVDQAVDRVDGDKLRSCLLRIAALLP